MKKKVSLILTLLMLMLAACQSQPRIVPIQSFSPTRTPRPTPTAEPTPEPIPQPRLDESGMTLNTRFNPPYSFIREQTTPGSFAAYLQSLPLKEHGSAVTQFDGAERPESDYEAVVDLEVLDKGEQAAGMLARLHMEYAYAAQEYESMVYTLSDGFQFEFDQWRQGKGIRLTSAEKFQWTDDGTTSDGRENFESFVRKYVDWSNVNTLLKDLTKVDASDPIRVGDVFINKTSTSNYQAAIVVDSITNEQGEQRVILAGGGKPAQQIRIWSNPLDSQLSPWIVVDSTNGRINASENVAFTIESRYEFAER